MKKSVFALAMAASVVSGSVVAGEGYTYECKHGRDVRKIDVVYLQRESLAPCEVNYTKDGVQETLWNATYSEGYCESRAKEFVEKQRGWGWECKLAEGVEPQVISNNEKTESEK